MTPPELLQPLNRLAASEIQEREVRALFDRVLNADLDRATVHSLILDLQAQLSSDRRTRKTPYCYILLSLTYFFSADMENALSAAEFSAHHFNNQGRDLQYAFSRWFQGMLFYKQGSLSDAKEEIEEAIRVLANLEKEDRRQGNYSGIFQEHLEVLREDDIAVLGALTMRAGRLPVGDFTEVFHLFRLPRSAKLIEDLRCVVNQLNPNDEGQIVAAISDLSSILNELKRDKLPPEPFLDAFLAYCLALLAHTRENQFALALQHSWKAIRGFANGNDLRNQAIAHWVHGLLYLSRGDEEICGIHLEKAHSLLEELSEKNSASGDVEKNREIERLAQQIRTRIQPPQSDQEQVRKLANRLRMAWRKRKPSSIVARFTKNPSPRRPRPAEEAPLAVKPPPDPLISRTPMLAVDNHGDGKKTKNRSTSNFQNEARDGALTGIIIPSLPYYGHVAAGPNGQPTLPDPSELMEVGAVNESRGFVFEGQTYQVDFIHKGRMSVSSHDGHKYGWLKVRGHSMDKAQPIPMKPDDLVLFKVMHELENSVGQIVVACMRDWDTQEPQLVVKRLERLYSSEANSSPSFGLFSESSYNLDPKTGVNYRNPIPIVRDGQVWGQVIAIAVQNQGGQFF